MTRPSLTLAVFIVLLASSYGRAAEKFDIRVLYAGNLGSSRAEDFVALLNEYFSSVAKVPYERFRASQADPHDVVVFDWTTIYPRDASGKIDNSKSIKMPNPPQLSADFTKPTILVGSGGGMICNRLSLAINWW